MHLRLHPLDRSGTDADLLRNSLHSFLAGPECYSDGFLDLGRDARSSQGLALCFPLGERCSDVAAMLGSTVGEVAQDPGSLGMKIPVGSRRCLGLPGMPAGYLCKRQGHAAFLRRKGCLLIALGAGGLLGYPAVRSGRFRQRHVICVSFNRLIVLTSTA
jgi:hypothetical protein